MMQRERALAVGVAVQLLPGQRRRPGAGGGPRARPRPAVWVKHHIQHQRSGTFGRQVSIAGPVQGRLSAHIQRPEGV